MVRMRTDTVSLCKSLRAWRHKTDDSQCCCDQQQKMRGKEQPDLRAPGQGGPEEITQRRDRNEGKLKWSVHAYLSERWPDSCPLPALHTRTPAARAQPCRLERASLPYFPHRARGHALTHASWYTRRSRRRAAACTWCGRAGGRDCARY